jgi:uncharacterized protein (TIRG00374 family)
MRNWKVWLGIAVSAACVGWAFRDVSAGAFFGAFRSANWAIAAPVMVLVLAIIYVRALRWKVLVGHLGTIPASQLYLASLVGFAVNNLLPARIGELARCYTLRRATGVRFASLLATVVVERMWDGASVVGMLLIAYSAWDFPGLDQALGVSRTRVLAAMAVSTGVLLGGFLLLRYASVPVLKVTDRACAVFPATWAAKIGGTLRTFVGGFQGIRGPGQWLAVIALSLAAWFASAAGMWLAAEACGARLTMEQATVVLLAIVAAVTIPASPGYVGTYHVLAKKALVWCGYAPEKALAVATMIHLVNYVPQTLAGLWALKRQGLDMAEVKTIAAPDREADGDAETAGGRRGRGV